jgi:hypothetical protein
MKSGMKISDILANPDKLREVIQESLGILKGRQSWILS